MQQLSAFQETWEDSLRDVVTALGGPKKVGHSLWPSKTIPDAARYLNHCLDPERHEKLAPCEIVWLLQQGRAVEAHMAMAWLLDACGYRPPEPITPEDEQAQLQREYIQAVEAFRQLAQRMERKGLRVA